MAGGEVGNTEGVGGGKLFTMGQRMGASFPQLHYNFKHSWLSLWCALHVSLLQAFNVEVHPVSEEGDLNTQKGKKNMHLKN